MLWSVLIFNVGYIISFNFVGKHKVVIRDASGNDHILSRYYAMWNMPRPESSVFVCFLTHYRK